MLAAINAAMNITASRVTRERKRTGIGFRELAVLDRAASATPANPRSQALIFAGSSHGTVAGFSFRPHSDS